MMADEAGALFEREGRAVRQQRQRFSRSFANLELRDKRWTRAQADRRDKRQEENKEPGHDLRVCDAPPLFDPAQPKIVETHEKEIRLKNPPISA